MDRIVIAVEMKFKKVIAIMSALPIVGTAQTRVVYTYNNGGYQIARQIVNENRNSNQSRKDTDNNRLGSQLFQNRITIGNETEYGDVYVEISGFDNTDDCVISAFSQAGQQILYQHASSMRTILPMSKFPQGFYSLRRFEWQ